MLSYRVLSYHVYRTLPLRKKALYKYIVVMLSNRVLPYKVYRTLSYRILLYEVYRMLSYGVASYLYIVSGTLALRPRPKPHLRDTDTDTRYVPNMVLRDPEINATLQV